MNVDGAPGPVIDAHHHVWDLSARAQPWLDQDGLGPRDAGWLARPAVLRGLAAVAEAFLVRGAAAGPDRGALDPLVRRYFDTSLRAFGPHRLMYGSDWPPCTLTSSYADVLTAARMLTGGLSPAEQAAVFGATARRVHGLGRTGPA